MVFGAIIKPVNLTVSDGGSIPPNRKKSSNKKKKKKKTKKNQVGSLESILSSVLVSVPWSNHSVRNIEFITNLFLNFLFSF